MKVRIISCSDGAEKIVLNALPHQEVTVHNIGHVGSVVSINSVIFDLEMGDFIPHQQVNPQNLEEMALVVLYTVMFDDGSRVVALNEELAFL